MAQTRFYEDPDFFRLQTLLLILALVAGVVMWLVPLFSLQTTETGASATVNGSGLMHASQEMPPDSSLWMGLQLVLGGLTVALVLRAVFLFRKRKLQRKHIQFAVATCFALPLVAVLRLYLLGETVKAPTMLEVDYGMIFPALAILSLIFADRAIRRDQARIRAMNRFW